MKDRNKTRISIIKSENGYLLDTTSTEQSILITEKYADCKKRWVLVTRADAIMYWTRGQVRDFTDLLEFSAKLVEDLNTDGQVNTATLGYLDYLVYESKGAFFDLPELIR